MKKKFFRKVFALFLAITMIVTMVPNVYADTEGEAVTVSNITLSTDKVELTDDVLEGSITFTADITGGSAGDYVYIEYTCQDDGYGDIISASLYYDNTANSYSCTINVDYNKNAGTYALSEIRYKDTIIECSETSSFVIEKKNTDVTGPVLESIEWYQNGVKLEAGAVLTQNDTLQARVKVSDESGINSINCILRSDVNSGYKNFYPVYDETLGCYVADISLGEMTAAEWYLDGIMSYDIYYNNAYFTNEGAENYFYIQDAAGNCEIPTYTYNVTINGSTHEVTTNRITSVKEMFPNGIPDAAQKEGYELIGWKYTYNGETISETDKFSVSGYSMQIFPVYDEANVIFTYNVYIGSESYLVTTGRTTSLQEMFPDGMPTSAEMEGYKIVGWKYNGNQIAETDTFEVDGNDICIEPVYEEIPGAQKVEVSVCLEYFDTNSNLYTSWQTLEFEQGITYGELPTRIAEMVNLSHDGSYTFTGWKYMEADKFVMEEEIPLDYYHTIYFAAAYAENPVRVYYEYVDENGVYQSGYKMVTLKADATYQNLINELKLNEIKHYEKLVFSEWKCSNLWDITDLNVKINAIRCNIKADYTEDVLVIDYQYIDENSKMQMKNEVVIYDEASAYYDLTKREILDLFSKDVVHNSKLTFAGYDANYGGSLLDEKLDPGLTYLWARSTYEEPLVYLYIYYWGTEGAAQDNYYVIAKEGMTFQEVYDSLELNYTHGKAFDKWAVDLYGKEMSSKVEKGVSVIYLTALYKSATTGGAGTEQEDTIVETPVVVPYPPVTNIVTTPVIAPEASIVPETNVENEEVPETNERIETEVSERNDSVEEEIPESAAVVKLDTAVIEEKVEEIAQAQEGTQLILEMEKEDGEVATEVPVEILEAVKGKDVEIVLDMGGYSWTINGKDVTASDLKAINLEVTLDTEAIAPTVVDALAGGEPTRQISLTHNGEFGFTAFLTINVGSEYEGEFGNLYYHESEGNLVFMNAGLIDAEGNVSLEFSHASDYVVVIGHDRTEEETLASNADANISDDAVDNAGTVEDANSGSSFPIVPIILVVVVIAVAAVVMMKKKNNNE